VSIIGASTNESKSEQQTQLLSFFKKASVSRLTVGATVRAERTSPIQVTSLKTIESRYGRLTD
jgi:hypothetical protein